jgi:hypothetical protein
MEHPEARRKMEAVAWIFIGLVWAFSAVSFYILWGKTTY